MKIDILPVSAQSVSITVGGLRQPVSTPQPRKAMNRFLCQCVMFSAITPAWLAAAPDDELVGEQAYDIGGNPAPEASFWDGAFWRDLTAPLESPVVPTTGNHLYFRSKLFDGTPMAAPAANMTIKTAAALGFTPPGTPPALGRLYFSNNVLRFDGTPDNPANPLGTIQIAAPGPLQLEAASSVDFDRTVVGTGNILVFSRSGITTTGDVTAAGNTFNLQNTGTTTASRTGAGPVSVLLARQDARVFLNTLSYSYGLHPSDPNTGNAPVFRAESGGRLTVTNAILTNPTGVVFDADAAAGASVMQLGWLSSSGKLAGADPLVMFRATGNGSPAAAATLGVTGGSQFRDLTGTFARATAGARIAFSGAVDLTHADNAFRVEALSGGRVDFVAGVRTSYLSTTGTAALDLNASGGGLIDGGVPVDGFLHLNGAAHAAHVSGGAEIRMFPNLGLDPGATLALDATGASSVLAFPNSLGVEPWDDGNPATPPGAFGSYVISVANGAVLRGGSLVSSPMFSYPDMRTIGLRGNTSASSVTVLNASAEYANVQLGDLATVWVGGGASGSTLRHVSFNSGSGSVFTMAGGSWQTASVDTQYYSQSLTTGGTTGGSQVNLNSGAAVHAVEINIGGGSYEPAPGDPPPPATTNCPLVVDGGSVWTGSLQAATLWSAKATVTFSGTGTAVGLNHADLGAIANPNINYGPGGPGFSGDFFFTTGGDADLSVLSGARLSVGSYAAPFGVWCQPDAFQPARLVAHGSDITLDASSAAFIGNAAGPAALDYRSGALVVGPDGFLLGTGTIHGAAADGNDLVVAGGTVAPGFSPGTLGVDGGFLMESGTLKMEIGSATPGDYDVIAADGIVLSGGTIRIKPTGEIPAGSSFSVDLFSTSLLSIAAGVTVEFDPALAASSFDRATGVAHIVIPASGGDANGNGVPDIIEEVLPTVNGSVEMPVLSRNPGGGSVYHFRRLDSSEQTRVATVQWSINLGVWNDIPIPLAGGGAVTVDELGSGPDMIQVVLPDTAQSSPFFVRLKVE